MKCALQKLALLSIIILTVVAAGGCGSGSGKSPESSKADQQAPEAGDTPAKAGETPNSAAAGKTGENAKTAEERRQLLETVGALTTAHCYQTYLNIGLIADGKAKGTYTDKDAYKVLDSVLSLLNSVDRKLATLGKIELDKQDRDSLEQMRDLADLLRQQGKELEAFWDSGKDQDAARYESVRKDSWAAIGKLTGIGRREARGEK
jgi:hypothetical protein